MTAPEKDKIPFVSATAGGDDVQVTIRGEKKDCMTLAATLFASVLKDLLPALPNAVLASAGKEVLEEVLDCMDETEHTAIDMAAIERGMQPF